MDINKLGKATKIFQSIKELDAEIIRLEAFAMQAANDDIDVKLKLDIVDVKKKDEEENKVSFDEDGSLATNFMPQFFPTGYGFRMLSTNQKEETKAEFSKDISNNAALQILGVLLFELQSKRMRLINKLENMGVAI